MRTEHNLQWACEIKFTDGVKVYHKFGRRRLARDRARLVRSNRNRLTNVENVRVVRRVVTVHKAPWE